MSDYKGLIIGKQAPIEVDTEYWQFGIVSNGVKLIDPQLHYTSFPLGYYDEHNIIDRVCDRMKMHKPEIGDNLFKSYAPTLNTPHVELCQKLYDMTNGYRTMFTLSGSDGVEAAVKLAFAYGQAQGRTRKKIVSFTDAYHGATLMTLTIGSHGLEGGFHGLNPYPDVIKLSPDMHETVDWDTVSCIVLETCPHISRYGPYDDNIYDKIKQIQSKHDVIVIVDDIWMSGGKTGSFFGFDKMPVNPDIFVQGKAITGGHFPLSTVMYNQKIHDAIQYTGWIHGHTYSFSLPGVCSMLEYMQVLEEHQYMQRVNKNVERALEVLSHCDCEVKYNYQSMFFIKLSDITVLRFMIPLNATDEYFDAMSDTIKINIEQDIGHHFYYNVELNLAKIQNEAETISNKNKGGKTQ